MSDRPSSPPPEDPVERIWTCKIGGPAGSLPPGADWPMRKAVQTAYRELTGSGDEFTFSGWGDELTEGERAVVENRLPDPDLFSSPDKPEHESHVATQPGPGTASASFAWCPCGWRGKAHSEREAAQEDADGHAWPSSPDKPEGQWDGVALIAAERERQVSEEGWTPGHDDEHTHGDLARAAICYAETGGAVRGVPDRWPWDADWWKPSGDAVRDLVKAGALVAAEIDRLHRLSEGRLECVSCGRLDGDHDEDCPDENVQRSGGGPR